MAKTKSSRKKNSKKIKRIWSLVLTILLFAGSLVIAFPPQDKINQGLDIQGGLSVVLSANKSDGQDISSEDMDKAKSIIESRVNALGASEATVQIQGDNQILVQIPGLSNSTQALDTIGKTGVLEFARLDSFTDETMKTKIESGQIIDTSSIDVPSGEAPTGALQGMLNVDNAKHIKVPQGSYTPLITGDQIDNVTIGRENDASANYAVNLRLNSAASAAFSQASLELAASKGKIVILLDGEVNSAPAVQSAITTGEVSITGNYSLEDAKALQAVLDSGSLPVSFSYEQSQTVGPTLGQGELSAGIMSMILGIIIVMLYLLLFYRGFGIIPALNMIVFFVIYMGVLGLLSLAGLFSLSLAGIAGIILSIGMTADSVILSIERFKEELKEGKSIISASESGVKHAIITSLDADVVSLISAFSLFFLATSTIKGFGLTLALGILCDILVMIVFVSPLIRLLAPKSIKYHPGFWGVKEAQLLGDVRADVKHYMTPEEVKEEKAKAKERSNEQKEKLKVRKAAEKERNKEANKKAKTLAKEQRIKEKQKKKEALNRLKASDAERDKARKEVKRTKRNAKVKSANEEVQNKEMMKLDDTSADENFSEFVNKVRTAKDKAVDNENEKDLVQVEDKQPVQTEARSADEINSILTSIAGEGFDIKLDNTVSEEGYTSGVIFPANEEEAKKIEDNSTINFNQPNEQVYENRAMRRAKAKKNKKN